MQLTDLVQVFSEQEWDSQSGDLTTRKVTLGSIVLSTGAIVACDPMGAGARAPFERVVAPGTYAVELAMASMPIDDRVAAARIVFSPRKVARWELATCAGQDPSLLSKTDFYGYGVDSGSGCFIDAAVAHKLDVVKAVEKARNALLRIPQQARGNKGGTMISLAGIDALAVFFTGYGDGRYPSYWGLDAKGVPAVLATDFLVMVEAVEESVRIPLAGTLKDRKLDALGVEVLRQPGDHLGKFIVRSRVPHEITLSDANGARLMLGCTISPGPLDTAYEYEKTLPLEKAWLTLQLRTGTKALKPKKKPKAK